MAFLAVLQILRQMERTRTEDLRAESAESARLTVQQWINLVNQPLQRFAHDFGEWQDVGKFLARPDPAWAEANLKQNLGNYDAHALWITRPDGEVIYAAQQNAGPPLPPPASRATFTVWSAARTSRHYFTEGRDGLLEVWAEPAGASAAAGEPWGWLLVAKAWNPRFLSTLSRLTEYNLQLAPASVPVAEELKPAHLLLALPGPDGAPVRQLQAGLPATDFAQTLAGDTLAVRLLLAFGLLVIVTVWLGIRQWVLRPLGQISDSLAREDVAVIRPLLGEKGELGHVAQLVESSFVQKRALLHENEERKRAEQALRKSEELVRRSLELRARLARDLHDGVIQSIYAAGLGLESAMSELEHDQAGARTRLQHCRQSLNGVIREVRGFINGLEPEQMHRHGFAQELAALARTMQALWPVRIVHKVDAQVAGRLTIGQEVHALQIARESISNALRHGGAKKVLITVSRAGTGGGLMAVRDDGSGFDPARTTGAGSGLQNLASRAREMGGTLQIDSQPGRGAVVLVSFPLAESTT
ncbi:MAG: Signal transduction histidine kinase [Lacunisphaera sp.]|nr:Signal transduction histidine kinase [Lacunisphaera sp.]